MKKLGYGLMVLVLGIALILSSCGNSGGANKNSGSKQLTAWAWNVNVPVLKKAAKEFAKTHKGFKLKIVEMSNNDAYQKITTGLQAGGKGLPDILLIEDDHVQGYLNNFPSEFVNVSKLGFNKQKSKFANYKINLLTKKGNVYGFPFDSGPAAVFYRIDLFKKAGVDPQKIKTWDDYIAAGKQIKAKTGKNMIGIDYNNDDGQYRIILNTLGSFYFNQKNQPVLDSQKSVEAMTIIQKMKKAGITQNTSNWDAWVSALANGETVSAPTGAWFAGSLIQQAPKLKGKWSVFPIPAVKAGGNRAANIGGSNFMIPTSSQNQKLAYQFLKYFSTSNKIQTLAMKEGGLFPSLNTMYQTSAFTGKDSYFTEQNIWKTFADEMDQIPSANYTENYSLAKDEAVKAQSKALGGGNVKDAMKGAQSNLKNRITK